MKKTLFTALSPNAETDDIFLALKVLFMPWTWKKGKTLQKLKNEFEKWLPSKHIFFFESGRTGLFSILKALNLDKNDEVLLQSYTCVAVAEPILWVGAKPVYVDCNKKNFTMSVEDLEKKITPQSKVLIIQHTFGHAADIEKILLIAQKKHLFVIEDCAHALGGMYKQKHLGTFGDASFFSFGRDKVISSVFGSAVSIKDEKLAEKIRKLYENYTYPSRLWIVQQLLHPPLLGFIKMTYDILIGKLFLRVLKKSRLISKPVEKAEKEGQKPHFIFKKFPNGLAILALHQFKKLDRFNNHRREITKLYKLGLSDVPVLFPEENQDEYAIFLRCTILTPESAAIIAAAKKEKIHLGDWYNTGIAPTGVNYEKIWYDPRQCPVTEKLAQETVNLPTDIHITKDDVLRIIYFLKRFYGSPHQKN